MGEIENHDYSGTFRLSSQNQANFFSLLSLANLTSKAAIHDYVFGHSSS